MKKLCVVDVMGALYRQRIYQMLDSQYDCIWLFGKPEGFKRRRMGVATARAETTDQARELAQQAADQVSAHTNS